MIRPIFIAIVSVCAVAFGGVAAERRLDLRPRSAEKPRLTFASVSPTEKGVLRQTKLSAGATTLPALEVGDTLALTLFDGVERSVVLQKRLESPVGLESFVATVSGYDGLANAVVVQSAEGLQVDLQDFKNSRVYTVVSSTATTTVREIDPKAGEITPCRTLVPEADRGTVEIVTPKAGKTLAAVDQSSTVVDILVGYDTGAAAWAKANGGGLQNFAATAVAKMNTALANDGLDSSFRFRLVGTTEISASATDVHEALSAVRDDESGWAAVKTKRDEVGADVVTVLIDTGSAYGTTGVGWSLERSDIASFSESAYNVCAVRAVAQSHTMTHEVGHNMGAGHATEVNPTVIEPGPQLYDYSAGYHFTANATAYSTIMAYSFDGYGNSYETAPLFSSPNAQWEGVAAGDASHDNARTLRNTYSAVSKWRAQKIALSYDVFFSPETETLFDTSVTVTLTPGKAGLAIRYTTDGSTPTLSSPLYSSPLLIKTTTTVKAATVNDGKLGPVHEARYLKSDLGTALNAPELVWTTSSDCPWVTETDNTFDGFAVQSCPQFIDDAGCRKTSWLKTTVTGPTELGFRYQKRQASSSFKVYCDNQVAWSDSDGGYAIGSSYDWNRAMVSLPAGTHEIKFSFEQGYGYYGGFNGIVLDTICFDAWSASPTISPATTASQATASVFTGSMTVTLTPPSGRTGRLFYTLDGSDPTQEGALPYTGPFSVTNSVFVQAAFVEPGREASPPARGYFLERHPVKPGEWTTYVEGAKEAASRDGGLLAVLCANRVGCPWTQRFMPIAESPEFLSWAEANGVYLITADDSQHVDTEAAFDYFCDLYPYQSISYPTFVFADPNSSDELLSWGLARNDGGSTIGGVRYTDTVDSLVRGFASVMGLDSVPAAPTISPDTDMVDSFPLTVTLTNPNANGTIYYTLDGSNPGGPTQSRYTGPLTINDKGTRLSAVVKNSSGVYGVPLVRTFRLFSDYANGYLGTQDIVWTKTSAVGWQESVCNGRPALRTGGYLGGEAYVSTLTAKVTGKGKFRFSYKFCNWHAGNTMQFSVNGVVRKRVDKYVGTDYVIETVEVDADGETTLAWTYSVSQPSYDYTSGYSAGGKSAWCGLWLYDVSWTPAPPPSTTTTPVAVPHTWIAEKFPTATPSTYETLMFVDSDGDGFLNWQEYLCGTDPNSAGTNANSVPRCTIKIVNNLPEVDDNIDIPAAAEAAGWRAITKGSTNLTDWSAANTAVHTFFKVVVEQQK